MSPSELDRLGPLGKRAHVLCILDEVGPDNSRRWKRSLDSDLKTLFRNLGFYGQYIPLHRQSCVAHLPKSFDDGFAVRHTWVKKVKRDNSDEYPRYHVLPEYAMLREVDGIIVLGVVLSAHIDRCRHNTDRSDHARDQAQEELRRIRVRSRAKLLESEVYSAIRR